MNISCLSFTFPETCCVAFRASSLCSYVGLMITTPHKNSRLNKNRKSHDWFKWWAISTTSGGKVARKARKGGEKSAAESSISLVTESIGSNTVPIRFQLIGSNMYMPCRSLSLTQVFFFCCWDLGCKCSYQRRGDDVMMVVLFVRESSSTGVKSRVRFQHWGSEGRSVEEKKYVEKIKHYWHEAILTETLLAVWKCARSGFPKTLTPGTVG